MSEDNYLRIKKTTPYYNAVRSVAFPSKNRLLISLFAIDTVGATVAFVIVDPTEAGLLQGLLAGVFVFLVPTIVSDIICSRVIAPRDPLFFMRRIISLSLFGSAAWIIMMLVGAAVSKAFPPFLYPSSAFYLGLFVMMPLRSVAVFSMSTASLPRRALFAVSDPLACSLGMLAVVRIPAISLVTCFTIAAVVSFAFSFSFLAYVERYGIKMLGTPPLRIFRAFLRDWLDGSFSAFENYLETFGVESTINVCVLRFRSKSSGNLKGTLVVSNFHPGPFLNVGSSALPYIIKRVIEARAGGVAAVAHGVSGHHLNLVSQHENEKVIERVLSMLNAPRSPCMASQVVRSKSGSASATCQVFGDSALITMTVAPEDCEDVDLAVGESLRRRARGRFEDIAVIDAHNSLGEVTLMSREKLSDLAQAAKLALKTTRDLSLHPLMIGVGHVLPRRISLTEGMGRGGITVFWTRIGDQTFAYVVFDSNNMATGLRERVLSALRDMGAADAEVMTSDTHMVNGITSARLGYYPIGAATDPEIIIDSVRRAADEAKGNIEPVDPWLSCSELQVRTLGLSSLGQLTNFVLKTARLTFATLFPVVLVIAIISFVFLV